MRGYEFLARASESLQQRLLESGASAIALCAHAWNEPGLATRLTLAVGQRLERSLGRCYPERGLVRIAAFVLDLPSELRDEIISHEAAHLVVFERHGRRQRPHGAEWKALMRSLGLAPRVRIQLAPAEAALAARAGAARVLYEHRCPVCHAARLARRRMSRWRCRECVTVGLLGLLEVSQTVGGELSL
jgi:predicted SprT family Zn-dependent metalloprotease